MLLATVPAVALQVLHCIADMPAEGHVLGLPRARRLALSRYCRSFRSCNALAPDAGLDELAAAIEARISSIGIDVVVPSDRESTVRLSQVAPKLSVPTFPLSSPSVLRSLSHKWDFYQFCRRNSLPVPKTILFATKDSVDAARIGDELGFPAVIKPVDQNNGNGVVVVRSRDEVEASVSRNVQYPYDRLIAQEFIPGHDIDCSLLARDGTTICSAIQVRDDGVIGFCENNELLAACSTALSLSRFDGVAHFDARCDARNGRIVLIECNPRFWRSIYAASACGLNFVAEGLRSAGLLPHDGPISLKNGAYLSPDRYLAAASGFKKRGDIGRSERRRALYQLLGDPLPVAMDFVNDELFPSWRRFRRQ